MSKLLHVILFLIVLGSCRGKKETMYYWESPDERRRLTLLPDNRFVLAIDAGYYQRVDSGTFLMRGDTLIINADKTGNVTDSLVVTDTLFEGARFVEVFEEEVVVDNNNRIASSAYREKIFPLVIVNDSDTLLLHSEDATFRLALIPDTLEVSKLKVIVNEDNTCRPFRVSEFDVPQEGRLGKSYALYLDSKQRRENYLAGFRWLVKDDTIESFFSNAHCDPTEIKLVRKK